MVSLFFFGSTLRMQKAPDVLQESVTDCSRRVCEGTAGEILGNLERA